MYFFVPLWAVFIILGDCQEKCCLQSKSHVETHSVDFDIELDTLKPGLSMLFPVQFGRFISTCVANIQKIIGIQSQITC